MVAEFVGMDFLFSLFMADFHTDKGLIQMAETSMEIFKEYNVTLLKETNNMWRSRKIAKPIFPQFT